MRIVLLSFVILFANEMRNVPSLRIGDPHPDDYYVGGKRSRHIPALFRRPTGFDSRSTPSSMSRPNRIETPISDDPPSLFESEIPSTPRPPSSYSSLLSSGLNNNPCDMIAVNNDVSSANESCLFECLDKQAEISNLFRMYPESGLVRFVHSRCGSVNGGKCGYFGAATSYSICWCHSPNEGSQESQSVPLFLCDTGISMVQTFANTENGIPRRDNAKQSSTLDRPPRFTSSSSNKYGGEEEGWRKSRPVTKWVPKKIRLDLVPDVPPMFRNENRRQFGGEKESWNKPNPDPKPEWMKKRNREEELLNTSRADLAQDIFGNRKSRGFCREEVSEEPEEEDNEPEGALLVADFLILGKKIRAVLDTGSGFTVFHKKFAKNYLPLDRNRNFGGANNKAIQTFGKATVNIQFKRGVVIPVFGFVAVMPYDLIIGNDFFVKYAAKLNISKRSLEFAYGQTVVKKAIKFREPPKLVAMMESADPARYLPLTILGKINGRDVNICVDTGASLSVASKNFVNPQNIRFTDTRVYSPDDSVLPTLGETNIDFLIRAKSFSVPALVFYRDLNFGLIIYALALGNSFNKHNVEVIDFEQKVITFKPPGMYNRITVQLYVELTNAGL